MAIADIYKTDFEALTRIIRKLDQIPDDIESLKVLNAVAAELNNWIPRHGDPEAMEVLTAISARLSPEAKPLPVLVNDYRQILTQRNAAAADEIVAGIKFAFSDALQGLREFLASKGIDPEAYEPPAPAPAPPPPPQEIPRDEMIEPTAIDTSGIPAETATIPDLEPTAVAADPAPAEPAAPAGYKCEFCGFLYQAPPGKFCDNCGRVLARLNLEADNELAQKKCLKCGHRNPVEERLCKNCGELLRDPEF